MNNLIEISRDPKKIDNVLKLFRKNFFFQSSAYLKSVLEYRNQISVDNKSNYEDKSFVILNKGEPAVLFIISTYKKNILYVDSFNGRPCFAIEDPSKVTSKILKSLFDEFRKISNNFNSEIWYRDFLVNGEISFITKKLLNIGAVINPILSNVIDLLVDENILKRNVRKSYKSLINWGTKELRPEVYDSNNISWEIMESFRKLHIREAGRETRSVETWKKQYKMIKKGDAFIVMGHYEKKLVSAGLFILDNNFCYYGVSASRRDLFDKPLFHGLMWAAMINAKKIGCKWFETGDQYYPRHPIYSLPNDKELGISRFKAGFGDSTKIFLDIKLSIESNN